jgi:YrbI family 3-deoxy-D-manno-octulosonate 8-phosphate phosphatase
MTDGKLYYSASGEELKRFSVRDGLGTILLILAGLETAIITSENSPIVTARAKKLKIKNVILGSRKKINALSELANKLNVNFEQIAFVGDDLNDLEVLKTVGFSACPRNAVKAVREVVDFISVYDGGNGAIREIAEKILLSQNKSVSLPDNW